MGFFDGLAGGLFGGAVDLLNFGEQKKQNAWERAAQERTWEREDNAVQRRKADMEKAGFNPLLAAGAAAQSSGPINIGAPQMGTNAIDKALVAANIMRQKKDISLTAAQEYSIQEGIKKMREEVRNLEQSRANMALQQINMNAERNKLDADRQRINKEYEIADWNLNKAKERNLPVNASGQAVEVLNALDGFKAVTKKAFAEGGILGSVLGNIFGKAGEKR